MNKKIKLLLVINDTDFFLSHRWPIAKEAIERGYDVHVASSPGKALDEITTRGVAVHPIQFNRKSINPLAEFSTIILLWRLYKELKPDVIHHVTIKPIIYGGFVSRMLGVKAVVHAVTGLGFIFSHHSFRAKIFQSVIRKAYRFSLNYQYAKTIFQNPDDIKEIWGASHGHRTVLIRGAGVDIEEFVCIEKPNDIPVIILASRMIWSKGVNDFVLAAKLLKQNNIKCRCVLVGDSDPGNPETIPTEQLQKWHDDKSIEWWGKRSGMADILSKAHIVTLPTVYREGVPKILIEGAACGCALIATDMPGCREIVLPDHNGFLIPPNDPEALALAITNLIKDPCMRIEMGLHSRALVENEFSLRMVLRETFKIYKELLNNSNYSPLNHKKYKNNA